MWRAININKQNIKADSGKAFLIACPHNSEYDGYCFWHPLRLIREGRHSNAVEISYTEEFVFYLKKDGKDEIQLAYDELEEVFGVMNENITAPQYKSDYETYKPQEIEAVERMADESLIDNE